MNTSGGMAGEFLFALVDQFGETINHRGHGGHSSAHFSGVLCALGVLCGYLRKPAQDDEASCTTTSSRSRLTLLRRAR
jgi:hypothetical protein